LKASRLRGGFSLRGTPGKNVGQETERRAEEAAQEASPWVERLARFGYVTKGAVYIVVGALAVGVATGRGDAPRTHRAHLGRSARSPSGG
jgi:hypothetical protein